MKLLPLTLLMLVATGSASAQEGVAANVELAELERRVKPGDEIFLTDREGRETRGRLMRISPAELLVLVGSEERKVEPAAVGRVEKRDPPGNGALIGAVPFALIGMASVGASCSPHCAGAVSAAAAVFAGIGAGVGALIDRRIRGYTAIYGPGVAPANAIRQGAPVESLGELWTRVRQGDTVRVLARSGDKITGTFVRASAGSMFVLVASQLRELPASEVRRVARRGNQYRRGALAGAALLGLSAAINACASSGGNGCSSGDVLFAAAFFGSSGALWGAGIGALIPKHAVVLESGTPATARVNPRVALGRVGVRLSLQF